MKINHLSKQCCLLAALVFALAAAPAARAATTPLKARITLRPLTPTDKTVYGLPSSTEISGGLTTTPIGEPVYLEAQVNIAIPAASITNVSWALTSQPIGSTAALTSSPLGTNIPIYLPSDALAYQVAGARMVLRPDLTGQYTITATIGTLTNGTTNVTQTITAGTYMGVQTCELCHSGGVIAPDKYHPWTNTLHASKFTRGINGQITGYGKGCISCHTVGYDTATNAVNGGFDDVATQLGWTFPTVLAPTNFASMPAALQNLANIQCENCHGPGSEHAHGLGDTNKIAVTWQVGNCGQCHDATTHHVKVPEWKASRHAITTTVPTGPGREACVGCHSAIGFADRLTGPTATTNTTYEPIGCAACHEPHDATNPHQLRAAFNYVLPDGTTVTNAGAGAFCMECHHNRNGSVTNMLAKYPLGQATWVGGSSFGPHDGPQGDMLEGVNAVTYGLNIPSSAHRFAVTNTCVGCHMQDVASSDPAFLKAGGHTFRMSYNVVTNGVTNTVDMVGVCVQCHGPLTDFDMPRDDYNGDGVIEGVQTEVQHLLDKLSTLLPNSSGVVDGKVKGSLSVKTNWTSAQLKAAYNWQFVNNDGSKGVHNAQFAVGILKASIADLNGDANNDSIPDWWQAQYFGSANNPAAAPNYSAAGDGVPNWLKYSLGLNPLVGGISVTNGLSVGVVWADGNSLVNPYGGTNTVQIYTAAEVSFNTEVGTTYQIQAVSSLSGGWQNVGGPIAGTGQAVSFVTPTRQNVKQFFRVAHTP